MVQLATAAALESGRRTETRPSLETIHFLLSCLLVFAFFAGFDASLRDGDTSWHLATGEWILNHRTIPVTDPFSYTFRGAQWTAHEWLSEVVMYVAWSLAGWPGLLLLFAVTLTAIFARLGLWFRRWISFPAVLVPLGICFSAVLAHAMARPHVFGWLMLVLWLSALLDARGRGEAPKLRTTLLMTLWANLHGSFLIGLALVGAVALEALFAASRERRMHTFKVWTGFGLVSTLAALATPHGIEGFLFPLKVSGMAVLPYIGEWAPSDLATLSPFTVALFAGLFLLGARRGQVPLLRMLVVLGLLYFALAHVRHQAIFFLVASIMLAEPVACAWRRNAPEAWQPLRQRLVAASWILVVVSLAVAGIATNSLLTRQDRPEDPDVPMRAIAAIPPDLRMKPVFNDYSFGGTLILNHVPVFIDGRTDMYGDAYALNYLQIAREGNLRRWEQTRAKWKIEWTILPPHKALVAYLDRQADWVRIYSDAHAVIHAKRSSLTQK